MMISILLTAPCLNSAESSDLHSAVVMKVSMEAAIGTHAAVCSKCREKA